MNYKEHTIIFLENFIICAKDDIKEIQKFNNDDDFGIIEYMLNYSKSLNIKFEDFMKIKR